MGPGPKSRVFGFADKLTRPITPRKKVSEQLTSNVYLGCTLYDFSFIAKVDHKKTFSRYLQLSAQNVFGSSTDTAKARMDSDSS